MVLPKLISLLVIAQIVLANQTNVPAKPIHNQNHIVPLQTTTPFPDLDMETILKAFGASDCLRTCIQPFIDEMRDFWQMTNVFGSFDAVCEQHQKALQCIKDGFFCDDKGTFAKVSSPIREACEKRLLFDKMKPCLSHVASQIMQDCDSRCGMRDSLVKFATNDQIKFAAQIGGNLLISIDHVGDMCGALQCILPCIVDQFNKNCALSGFFTLDLVLKPISMAAEMAEDTPDSLRDLLAMKLDKRCHFMLSSEQVNKIRNGDFTAFNYVYHKSDCCCNPLSMGHIKKLIEENVEGVYVKSLMLGENIASDVERGFFANMNDLVDKACEMVRNDSLLAGGYNAIGFSQGGQFVRALAQRCPDPPVKNLISVGGQQQGVFGLPHCIGDNYFCNAVRRLLDLGAVVQAQYWHDPNNEKDYQKKSIFLADVNNEVNINETYRKSIVKLKNLVLIKFLRDSMVVPRESSWFGYYKANDLGTIENFNETRLYKEVPDVSCTGGQDSTCASYCKQASYDLCISFCQPKCCHNETIKNFDDTNACTTKHLFYSNSSSTYQAVSGSTFDVTYKTGEVKGFYGKDTFCIGGTTLCATSQQFVQATFIGADFAKQPEDGMIGLAWPILAANQVTPPLFNLMNQGKLDQPYFSIFMVHNGFASTDQGGTFTAGGIDSTNCKSDINWIPLTSQTYWQFKLSGVASGSYNSAPANGYQVMSTTAASFNGGPKAVLDKLAHM
ncbi:hypothetical protein WR25_26364 [Diploscapter pachys]|uniref:Peptidase A1 domain-containing protein n=1 Tax=Diploscapter pachys TaxID=2018661 RepID=A0A2A2JJG7_9BILA|nr:hypothetical protein WR25_26364 [Diploscapter pachys]